MQLPTCLKGKPGRRPLGIREGSRLPGGRGSCAPIRTVTVGPGLSPGQPPGLPGGLRAVTAGEEFHLAPRTTLTLSPVPSGRQVTASSLEGVADHGLPGARLPVVRV